MAQVDLNSDLGEVWRGVPTADDDAMFALITSANVACGFHAGDDASMRDAVRRSTAHGVSLGAHPSYRDEAGFGRRDQDVPAEVLEAEVLEQLRALQRAVDEVGEADGVGARLAYVKPHGALYNRVAHDRVQARAVVRAVVTASEELGRSLPVLGMPGSVIEQELLAAGLRFVAEAFVDRGYRSDGSLVPRDAPGALVTDETVAVRRAVSLALDRRITSVDGADVELDAVSLCVHGDTPGAVLLATAVRAALLDAGVELVAPW
ncbi:LamB/YcsF family protein [Plantibacter sp. PA-3-X8]|uniref:LamB/YcsF family protein n=1 Tax=unclassified Plantibacter TaxID=2624265 RepID=UPI000F5F17F8|nr:MULTISPECIES: 5-oxoprolinase subunit PxpA [unclassified Plantibacter]AZH83046.1 LamB/YcsF family protein [Plantibacter sp. PA-3-X8]MBD8536109.1 LamB/YcsF family protein [Plantibacter sp. CFBP 13570]